MARIRRFGVVLALSALAVSGSVLTAACGGDDTGAGDASESSSSAAPSASPAETSTETPTEEPSEEPSATPTEAVAPEQPEAPPPPKATNSAAGRRDFARYVVTMWSYALATNEPGPLVGLSPSKKRPCDGCRQLEAELRERDKEGWYVDFPGAEMKDTEVLPDGAEATARMTVSIPESDSYNDDGSYRSTNPAHAKAGFDVRMRYGRKGFQLLAFGVNLSRR